MTDTTHPETATFTTREPATGRVIAAHPVHGPRDVTGPSESRRAHV